MLSPCIFIVALAAVPYVGDAARIRSQQSKAAQVDGTQPNKALSLSSRKSNEEENKKGLRNSCRSRLKRIDLVNGQKTWNSGEPDPLFPPDVTSIAELGATCGDSAQGLDNDCASYNKWTTFGKVARAAGHEFKVMRQDGVGVADVKQGQLGNCYFLAAIAAIAHNHPEIIEEMFIDRHLWEQNIFRTKWLLMGNSQVVAVDSTIPGEGGELLFTQLGPRGAFWPLILAKSWAKIFGNFHAAESGSSTEVIRAITRAPGQSVSIENEDEVWQSLLEAVHSKYPMTAGTSVHAPRYGLAIEHAYAVLDVYVQQDGRKTTRVVDLFNPWSRHNYNGRLSRLAASGPRGVFTMPFDEFVKAFAVLHLNYVRSGYAARSIQIPVEQLVPAQVDVPRGKFWVSVVFPSERMIAPCEYLKGQGSILGESVHDRGKLASVEMKRLINDNDQVVEFENTAGGSYNILATMRFEPTQSYAELRINEVALTVYAAGTPKIKPKTISAQELAFQMLGPMKDRHACKVVTLPDSGIFVMDEDKLDKGGFPTYWALDKARFANYDPERNLWYVSSSDHWPSDPRAPPPYYGEYEKSRMMCADISEIKPNKISAQLLNLELFAPTQGGVACKVITLPDNGIFVMDEAKLDKGGFPTYWALDKARFANYVPALDLWSLSSSDHWPSDPRAPPPYYGEYEKRLMMCADTSEIKPNKISAQSLNLELFAPTKGGVACKVITLPGNGIFVMDEAKLDNGGLPTYWRPDRTLFANYDLVRDLWYVSSSDNWPSDPRGPHSYYDEFEKSLMTCGCSDDQTSLDMFEPRISCHDVASGKFSNLDCQSSTAQLHCAHTCGKCPKGVVSA